MTGTERTIDRVRADGAPSAHGPVVRYAHSPDGSRIAWSVAGSRGQPLIHLAGWMSHLMMDWGDGDVGEFNRALATHHRLIRYDRPGIGLSAGEPADFKWERQFDHVSAVLNAAGEHRVIVFGKNFSGLLAVAYAALHPDRVSHLILFDTAERILPAPDFSFGVSEKIAMAIERLVLAEWGLGSKAVAEFMLPDASAEQLSWYSAYQRMAASPEAAAAIIRETIHVNVSEYLSRIQAPTLVLHHRDDRVLDGIRGKGGIPARRWTYRVRLG